MPRYFVHFRHGRTIERDDIGMDFDDIEHAYLSVHEGAVAMWSELLRERRDPRDCAFEVMDERDQMLFLLPFMEVLDSCSREDRPVAGHWTAYHHILATRNHSQHAFREFKRELDTTLKVLAESRALIQQVANIESTAIRASSERNPPDARVKKSDQKGD